MIRDKRVRSLHALRSGEYSRRSAFPPKDTSMLYKYQLRRPGCRSQVVTLRGGWKFREHGPANTLALLQKYICYIFVQS